MITPGMLGAATPTPGAVIRYIHPLVPGAAYECCGCFATDPKGRCSGSVSGWHWMDRIPARSA